MHHAESGTPEHDALFWAWEQVNDLCSNDPDAAFAFILAVLAHDQSARTLANLAAGPLEDLLARHPHEVIERVEAQAKSDPQFAHLLGGVWKNTIPDDVWKRVQAVTPLRW